MGLFGDIFDIAGALYADRVNKQDTKDLLKSLIFVASFHATLNKANKKVIANVMKLTDNEYTLFEHEEEIDAIYNSIKSINTNRFFSEMLETRIDRDKIIVFFAMDLALIYLGS